MQLKNLNIAFKTVFFTVALFAFFSPLIAPAQERTVFDIYVGGNLSGGVMVDFTEEWVEIRDAKGLAGRIPNALSPAQITPLFEGRLYAGENKNIPNVGTISVNPAYFRMDITIDPSQLKIQALEDDTIIPEPENNLAMRIGLRGTASTNLTLEEDRGSTLTHNNIISKGRWNAKWRGHMTKGEGYDLRDLYSSYEDGLYTYSLGMVESAGLHFASSKPLIGFDMTTNYKAQFTSDRLFSTPVEVFVPGRSRVQILQNDSRIIYARTLEFGLQEIDTSRFPEGSYEILIRITKDDGTITEERQRFVKSKSIAPKDRPNISFQVGLARGENFNVSDQLIYQLSREWRVWPDTGLELSIYGSTDSAIIESELFMDLPKYEINTALSLSSEGDSAVYANLQSKTTNGLYWQAGLTKTLTGHHYQDTDDEDLPNVISTLSDSNFTINGSVNYSIQDWNFRLQGSRSQSSYNTRYRYGPAIKWNAYSGKEHYISTEFRYLRTQGTPYASFLTTYRWRPRTNIEYSARLFRNREAQEDLNILRNTLNYSTNSNYVDAPETTVQFSHDITHGNERWHSSYGNLEHRNSIFGFRGSGQYINDAPNAGDSEYLDFEAETNIFISQDKLLSKEREIRIASRSTGESTLLVDLKGNAVGQEMEILVNGNPRAIGKVGSTVSINAPLYKKLSVEVRPTSSGSGLVTQDKNTQYVVMYPGNIIKREWQVDKVYLVLGRLVNIQGQALDWENIKGVKTYSATDNIGQFQLELTGAETPYIDSDKNQCTIALPPVKGHDGYLVNLGDVVCG